MAAKHGHTGHGVCSPTYRVWTSMKGRCRDKGNASYPFYGGRGIQVCDRWQTFDNFLADMGARPEGKTLGSM